MNANNITDIVESVSVLGDSQLNNFYISFYEDNFIKSEECWANTDNEAFIKIIRLLENRCINNFKKFQILPLISHDPTAFELLQNESEILKNDEELNVYISCIKTFFDKMNCVVYEKTHILELEIFTSIIPKIGEFEDKIRMFESFKDMYENYDRHTLQYCKDYVDEHKDF
jgi:hypothetical protein